MRDSSEGADKKGFRRNRENVIVGAVAFLYSLIFMFQSHLHPWIGSGSTTDSSVFRTVAFMMKNGYMPYRDTFDHKGPLLYLLNYLGESIAPELGIFLIEILFFTATVFVLYKISRLVSSPVASGFVTLLATSILFTYFEGGNFTEEYAMPFIATALYIFLDYLLNDWITRLRLTLCGFGFGAVLMLRPNMIAVWIVFCVYIFILLLQKKQYKDLRDMVLFFLLGLAIVIVPILIWLFARQDLSSFWQDYIVFNFRYSSLEGGRATFQGQVESFLYFAQTTVFIVSVLSLLFQLKEKKDRILHESYILLLFLSVWLSVMSGMAYGHYGMILVPAVIYPLSLIIHKLEIIEKKRVRIVAFILVALVALGGPLYPGWHRHLKTMKKAFITRDERDIEKDTNVQAILSCIEENTSDNEKISVFGNYDLIYLESRRMHATRYSYQDPIGTVMPEIIDEYLEELEEDLPKVIVVEKNKITQRMYTFLLTHGYTLMWSAEAGNIASDSVYVREK